MKVVFESYLLYFVTRIYKATTLYKNCRKLFERTYIMENVENFLGEDGSRSPYKLAIPVLVFKPPPPPPTS